MPLDTASIPLVALPALLAAPAPLLPIKLSASPAASVTPVSFNPFVTFLTPGTWSAASATAPVVLSIASPTPGTFLAAS